MTDLTPRELDALNTVLDVVVMAGATSDLAPYITDKAEGFLAALAGVDPPLIVVPLATPPQPSAGLRAALEQARTGKRWHPFPDALRHEVHGGSDHRRRDAFEEGWFAALAAEPDAGEGLDNVIERLAAKARKWRDQGWVSDAEWGAICAVLYVGEATDVTDVDRKWAMGEIDRRATTDETGGGE